MHEYEFVKFTLAIVFYMALSGASLFLLFLLRPLYEREFITELLEPDLRIAKLEMRSMVTGMVAIVIILFLQLAIATAFLSSPLFPRPDYDPAGPIMLMESIVFAIGLGLGVFSAIFSITTFIKARKAYRELVLLQHRIYFNHS